MHCTKLTYTKATSYFKWCRCCLKKNTPKKLCSRRQRRQPAEARLIICAGIVLTNLCYVGCNSMRKAITTHTCCDLERNVGLRLLYSHSCETVLEMFQNACSLFTGLFCFAGQTGCVDSRCFCFCFWASFSFGHR